MSEHSASGSRMTNNMKTSITEENSKIKINIELDSKEWQDALKETAVKMASATNIKGFRPGKAPLDVVITQVGETKVLSEAADASIAKYYAMSIREHNIIPLAQPKISINHLGLDKPLSFMAEVISMPKVSLGDYKKITVKVQPIKVDKAQVEKTIKDIQRRAAKFNEVNRPSKVGDWAEIDFTGTLDGKPFEGGSSKNHPLVIGDGVFLPDFETALVGIKMGEEKTFDVTFPKDYHQANLADKKVQFVIKVHKIKEIVLPPIDDELAKTVGEIKTLKDLQSDIEKWLMEEANKKEKSRQQEEAMEQLVNLIKVDIPEELIEQELTAMIQDFSNQLIQQKKTLEDYLKNNNITEEKLKEQWKDPAKKRVLAGLALEEFKQQERIEASDKEVEKDINRMKQMYPDQKEAIEKRYENDLEKRRLKHMLAGKKALEHLWSLATQE